MDRWGGAKVYSFICFLIVIVLFNIPFGYWRANVRKLSVQWFLAIHLPVPFVAYLRQHSELPWLGLIIIAFIAAYFAGQYLGSGLYKRLRDSGSVSSSIFRDILCRSWIILITR
ncbi:MAG: hypothetical protein AB7E31_09645 [Desulfitobacterium sp.]